MDSFVSVYLWQGKVFAQDQEGHIWMFQMIYDKSPIIHKLNGTEDFLAAPIRVLHAVWDARK